MDRLIIFLALALGAPLVVVAKPSEHPPEKISVDFTNERQYLILWNIADFYGLKLSVPETFPRDATVSHFKLRDVTRDEIFDLTLAGTGYSYAEKDGRVEVVKGSTDARAVRILQRELREQMEEDSGGGAVLYRLLKIEDPVQLAKTRDKLWAIVNKGNWKSADLLAVMDNGSAH